MNLTIFNVGHGSCAYLIADNRNVALFDCGRDEAGFRPSSYLPRRGCTAIEHLYISHFDQDHVADLPDLLATLPIRIFYRNRSMSPDQIRQLKLRSGPLEQGVRAAIDMISGATDVTPHTQAAAALGGVEVTTFCNDYPTFQDMNNLSLVSFIHHAQVSIVLPGDLEKAGWQQLLGNPTFREHLGRVQIFVASHHGRENGYLPEVFNYCTPDIVIISDTAIQYATQENKYAQHARGLPWNNRTSTRYVLTTRHDGNITIETPSQGGYFITAQRELP